LVEVLDSETTDNETTDNGLGLSSGKWVGSKSKVQSLKSKVRGGGVFTSFLPVSMSDPNTRWGFLKCDTSGVPSAIVKKASTFDEANEASWEGTGYTTPNLRCVNYGKTKCAYGAPFSTPRRRE